MGRRTSSPRPTVPHVRTAEMIILLVLMLAMVSRACTLRWRWDRRGQGIYMMQAKSRRAQFHRPDRV